MAEKLDFVTWLRGWVELNDGAMPTERQWEMIKDHLNMGFEKVTPTRTPPSPSIPPMRDSISIADLLKKGNQQSPIYPPVNIPYQPPYWLDNQIPSRDLIFC